MTEASKLLRDERKKALSATLYWIKKADPFAITPLTYVLTHILMDFGLFELNEDDYLYLVNVKVVLNLFIFATYLFRTIYLDNIFFQQILCSNIPFRTNYLCIIPFLWIENEGKQFSYWYQCFYFSFFLSSWIIHYYFSLRYD